MDKTEQSEAAEFQPFPKIPRLSREIIVTEKLDGTNGQIFIGEDGQFLVGSRNRWITPEQDNHGFARWAHLNREELLTLGAGRHYGEWWGSGIQRTYGLPEKRFSLFNVSRWAEERPACCHVVPTLYRGEFSQAKIDAALAGLRVAGSQAAPGFMRPEGVIVFHVAANSGFKKTLERDQEPKGLKS
jgi:hypothetical protein